MPTFVTPIDNKQTIFSYNTLLPLTYGKLKFFELNTSTPKTVYQDIALAAPGGTTINLDISGRVPFQPYLGYGDYFVQAYRFIGTDPYSNDPINWVLDHEWNSAGLITPNLEIGSPIATCDSIATLRGLTPTTGATINVLGYYAAGDCFVRTYAWNDTNLNSDNSGTIIKNPSYSTGSWLLKVEGDVVDCRVFGILPGASTVVTSRISGMVTAIESSTNIAQTLFFPRGIYRVTDFNQTIQTHLYLDKGVQFFNEVAAGPGYVLNVAGQYTIEKLEATRSTTSTGAAYLKFANPIINGDVDIRWYGALLDGVTDDIAAFEQMLGSVQTANYNMIISGNMRLAAMQTNLVVSNPLVFRGDGRIYMNQTTYTVEFKAAPINETNGTNKGVNPIFHSSGTYVFYNLNKFKFTGVDIRSSWFMFRNGTTGLTQNLDQPLNQFTVSQGTNFIFDAARNAFGASVDTKTLGLYNFIRERGTLEAVGTNTNVVLNNFSASDSYCIDGSGKFTIHGSTVRLAWFTAPGRTQQQNSDGFAAAVTASLRGSGVLDLCNQSTTVLGPVNLSIYQPSFNMFNGVIQYNSATPLLNFTNSYLGDFLATNVTFSSSVGSSFVSFATISSVSNMLFRNLDVYMGSASSYFIRINAGCTVTKISITDSTISVGNFLANAGTIDTMRIGNNDITVAANIDIRDISPIVSNNYFNGAGVFYATSKYAPQFNNNFFNQLALYMNSYSGGIDSVVTGNTFNSQPSHLSQIMFLGNEIDTKFQGAVVTSNTFVGSYGSAINVIGASGTFDATASPKPHKLQISGNTCNPNSNLYLPQTEASGNVLFDSVSGDRYVKMYINANVRNIFQIPGSLQVPDTMFLMGDGNPQNLGNSSFSKLFYDLDGGGYYLKLLMTQSASATTTGLTGTAAWKIY